MASRLIFAFTLAVLAGLALPADAQRSDSDSPEAATRPTWGTLSGTILFNGDVPKPRRLTINKGVKACGKQGLFDESLVVDPKSKGIKNVVIWLRHKHLPRAAIHPSYAKTRSERTVVKHRCCRIEPHVATHWTSQILAVENADVVGHSTKIDFLTNPGIGPSIPVGGSLELSLLSPEPLPCTVSCNIHPWEKGYVLIQDHPYMAVTDHQGKFRIEHLPAGRWTFQFWHEQAGYLRDVILNDKPAHWPKGRPTFTVQDGKTTEIGTVRVKIAPQP